MRTLCAQDYANAKAALRRQLAIIEKTFGAGSPRTAEPVFVLGSIAAGQKNYAGAESYFLRALDFNPKSLR